MQISDAQKEVRTVFAGGFFGQLVSSAVWLSAAALGTWISPRAGIEALVGCGFFIFPLTMLCLRMAGRRTAVSRENPMGQLAMQTAFGLVVTMLLLAPVAEFRLELFFPAMMVLLGAHYLPFTFLTGCGCSWCWRRCWPAVAWCWGSTCMDRSAWADGWAGGCCLRLRGLDEGWWGGRRAGTAFRVHDRLNGLPAGQSQEMHRPQLGNEMQLDG